ncbi:MAG: trigger factor [Oscillospiraceae bacterium]|jgi:trigger factor|nr:trigger factor [Oscillospiraceae bacterium]
MKLVKTEPKEKSIVELTIEVTAEEFENAIRETYKKSAKNITVPGFRKGKAPRKIIEKLYGESFFWNDAVNASYDKAFEEALAQSGLDSVGKAGLDITEVNAGGYTFVAAVPVKPEVEISDYKGIKAEKAELILKDAEIDDEIDRTRKRNSSIETADRAAKEGDTAVIDFEGFLDGVPFEGGKGENHSLEIGSGQFIPGFEEQLIGCKAGDDLDVNVTFPAEYHAEELAGKAAVFKVKLHEVKQVNLPELDDEFAKDVSEFDTFEEYRNDVKAKLSEAREKTIKQDFENSVFDVVAEKVAADIPDAMIDAQVDNMLESFAYNLSSQGIDFNQYMQMTGMDMNAFTAMYRPQAERQVKLSLAFDKIAELENVEVSAEELDEEYNKMAEQYKMPVDQVKILLAEENLRSDLKRNKASLLVIDAAVAGKPEEKAVAAEKAAEKKPAAKKPAAKKPAEKKPEEKTGGKTDEADSGSEAEEKPKKRTRAKKAESADAE